MTILYPEKEPYERGFLDMGAGQQLYWEACGNPDGAPALYLHGGPGSGCSTSARRYF
ncbi:pimeloyl-ACP methyl ester carboxylesterase [Rhizobium sp. BK176]|nr:pimeloyl-ACP methyl ester carboxylesterase [Rhizobium sp. BK399]MCS3742575.1 pimeloyl-ACP methyl ester carboxylesterase [Rhizobium sp. BK661]MCS4094541.1 pimeloyl-ACP methyl ester carboxylesterase [Rhizobium sp. BK176]